MPSTLRTSPHTPGWFRPVVLALSTLVLASGGATLAGMTPWPFLVAFGLAVTVLAAPAIGWGRAAWGSVALALFAASWVVLVNPYIGTRLDVAMVVVLSAAVVALLVVVWIRSRRVLFLLPRIPAADLMFAVAPAALSSAALGVVWLSRGLPLSWAMRGDAQFNTVLSRLVGQGGGETKTDVAILSLAQGLMALVHLPGRANVASNQLLIHDVTRQAELWLLMILLSSVLAGMIARMVLRGATRWVRWVGILGAAALPLTWHMTGYAMDSGFYNVSLTFLAVELGFYFYLTTARTPLIGSAIGLAVSVVMLGAWTPMAVITVFWSAWLAWQGFRRRPASGTVMLWIVAVAQFIGFVVGFILPSYLSDGSVLTHDGTILPLAQSLFVAVVAAAVLIGLAVVTVTNKVAPEKDESSRHLGVGLGLLALSSALGTAVLVFQNRHLPQPWIYYPIKFAWVAMEMTVLVVWVASLLLISRASRVLLVRVVSVAATVVLLVSVLQLNPPSQGGYLSYFPLASLVKSRSSLDSTLPLLSSVAGKKVFFSRYASDEQDTFMDQWQFQLTAKDEFTPIRGYAYRLVSSLSEVCDASKTWGGGVTVYTSDERWEKTLNSACGDQLTAVFQQPTF